MNNEPKVPIALFCISFVHICPYTVTIAAATTTTACATSTITILLMLIPFITGDHITMD